MISGFLRDFRVLIQSSVFAVIFVFAVSGGGGGGGGGLNPRPPRGGPPRGFFCVFFFFPPGPHLVLGGMLRLRVARFLDIAILGNAVFLEYCVFLKRAIFEKALYDFMRDEG